MTVEFESELPVALAAAHEALRAVLVALSERSRDGRVTLAAAAHGSAGDLARLEVPVEIETDAATALAADEFVLRVRAKSASGAFPAFDGTVGAEARGAAVTRVRLRGAFTVPMGALGVALNALALDSIARGGLSGLLDTIVGDANALIRERAEIDHRRTL
jgi:hypothetical protein